MKIKYIYYSFSSRIFFFFGMNFKKKMAFFLFFKIGDVFYDQF